MATHNDIGRQGEALARQYLVDNGYAILDTNWRLGRYEVDIIAYREGLIVFVEVKTRSNVEFGSPEEFVTRDKMKFYLRMANKYVIEHHRDEPVRFDIIAITVGPTGYHLDHIPDAFSAIDVKLSLHSRYH